jgi:homoserine dehydrogenase
VHGVFNAILIKGNVIGEVMFYGAGAGKLPTASAVVADIIDASKHKGKNIIVQWSIKKMELMPMADGHFNYFIRVKLHHEKEGRAFIEKTFNHVEWVQVEEDPNSIGFITDTIREGDIALNIKKLDHNEAIIAVESMIRLER